MAAEIDPVLEALDRAPLAEEDLDPEEVAELERRSAEMRSGRVKGIDHADVQRTIAAMRPLAG